MLLGIVNSRLLPLFDKKDKVEEKSLAHFLFSTFLFWYDVSKMSEKSYE